MEIAGDALVMDVAVLTRLNIFGVFVLFLRVELQFSLQYICVFMFLDKQASC